MFNILELKTISNKFNEYNIRIYKKQNKKSQGFNNHSIFNQNYKFKDKISIKIYFYETKKKFEKNKFRFDRSTT